MGRHGGGELHTFSVSDILGIAFLARLKAAPVRNDLECTGAARRARAPWRAAMFAFITTAFVP